MKRFLLSFVIVMSLAGVAKAAVSNLDQDITGNGMNQGDLVILLQNLVNVVNDNNQTLTEIIANQSAFYSALDTDLADVTNASSDYNARFGSGGSDGDPLAAQSETTDTTLSAP